MSTHRAAIPGRDAERRLAGCGAEDTFTYGVLHQRQACQAADIERALPQHSAQRG